MDASLFSSCALVGILAAGMGCWLVKKRLPPLVMPFGLLPEEMRERITRRKLCWRGTALAAFALAAATLFSGLPRGVTVLCVCVGFFCQYKVFCLRRRYPMSAVFRNGVSDLPDRPAAINKRRTTMKGWKSLFRLMATCALLACFAGASFAAAPVKMKTAWMDEHETFLIWYAKEKGWDKAEGLDLHLGYFESGMAILNALPAGEWVIAGVGGVPAVIGNVRFDTYVVLNGNDESLTNAVMVRPDSPILKTKGYNKNFPDVYGDPKDIKGKTILCTTVSSAHFALSHWLNVLGLKDSDVVIKNMDQAQALAAFSTGIGDAVVLWAPHMYAGEEKGWKVVGTPKTCKQGLPIDIIADKKFADKNPELVAKFLRVYLRAINMLQKESLEKLVPDYRRFFLEWAGNQYSAEMALKDLQTHPVFNYAEQIALFDTAKGPSTAQKWHTEIARFFTETGRITKDDLKKVESAQYCTDKFLKQVKQPIPAYK